MIIKDINRRACGHVDVGTRPHQVLASTLTLSQPEGADYAHRILMSTPSFESHRRACNWAFGANRSNYNCFYFVDIVD